MPAPELATLVASVLGSIETYTAQPPEWAKWERETGNKITYARRYALGSILNLNIDDDDDGEKAMGRQVPKKEELTPKHPNWAKAIFVVPTPKFEFAPPVY